MSIDVFLPVELNPTASGAGFPALQFGKNASLDESNRLSKNTEFEALLTEFGGGESNAADELEASPSVDGASKKVLESNSDSAGIIFMQLAWSPVLTTRTLEFDAPTSGANLAPLSKVPSGNGQLANESAAPVSEVSDVVDASVPIPFSVPHSFGDDMGNSNLQATAEANRYEPSKIGSLEFVDKKIVAPSVAELAAGFLPNTVSVGVGDLSPLKAAKTGLIGGTEVKLKQSEKPASFTPGSPPSQHSFITDGTIENFAVKKTHLEHANPKMSGKDTVTGAVRQVESTPTTQNILSVDVSQRVVDVFSAVLREKLAFKSVVVEGHAAFSAGTEGRQAMLTTGTVPVEENVRGQLMEPAHSSFWTSGSMSNAEMKLDDIGGGSVDISISLSGKHAHVSFWSDESQTRVALESAGPTLREMLHREGVELSGITVGLVGTSLGSEAGEGRAPRPKADFRPFKANDQTMAVEGPSPLSRRHSGNLDVFV